MSKSENRLQHRYPAVHATGIRSKASLYGDLHNATRTLYSEAAVEQASSYFLTTSSSRALRLQLTASTSDTRNQTMRPVSSDGTFDFHRSPRSISTPLTQPKGQDQPRSSLCTCCSCPSLSGPGPVWFRRGPRGDCLRSRCWRSHRLSMP